MISWADVEGHWRRDWLRAGALEDRDTRVHWIQAGALFVDIRIPDGRPALGERTRLAELDNPELLALMAAEGFAGTITLEEDRCTWHRELNWRGRPEGADVGRLYFDGGALIEDGVLATYRERWLSETNAPYAAHRIEAGGQNGILVENETTFMLGLGPEPTEDSSSLRDALAMGAASIDDLAAHFQSIYCLGQWRGGQGVAVISTNPFAEGSVVLERDGGLRWRGPDFFGARADVALVMSQTLV